MKIGRIEYLNLLPFFVFLKQSPLTTATKQFAQSHHSYPAKLNMDYLFRRIDSGFISSFAARKQRLSCAGIVGRGKVQSVLAIIGERGEDEQSATSNALLQTLHINGRVLIGDRALVFYLAHDSSAFVDLAEAWFAKHRLPFVFGRFCYQTKSALHEKLARHFVQTRVKIPHYLLTQASRQTGIAPQHIRDYLCQIFYQIGAKERKSIRIFYTHCNAQRLHHCTRF